MSGSDLASTQRTFRRIIAIYIAGLFWFLFTIAGEIPVLERGQTARVSGDSDQLTQEAYFKFDYPPEPETFIFRLTDPVKIQQAREILSETRPNLHVGGVIVKTPATYNSPWHYHLDPDSIFFFSSAIEVCDAGIRSIEEHLDEACDSFLPGCTWCPWGSRLLAEVTAVPTPTWSPTPTIKVWMDDIYLPLVIKGV